MKSILALIVLIVLIASVTAANTAQAESYIDREIDQVLRHVSTLPLVGPAGKARMKASYSGALVGEVKWTNGCRFQISDFKGGSLVGYSPRHAKIRGVVTSPCLGASPLRLFVDVTYDYKTGRVQTAQVYARQGTTNHLLATCGRFATLTSAGQTCE